MTFSFQIHILVTLLALSASSNPSSNQDRLFKAVSPISSSTEIVITGTFDEVQHYFEEHSWSDGIAVTPPTTDKVEKYLLFTPYRRDQVLVNHATTYNVAVNAIMSGCLPQMMPLCIAITEALANDAIQSALKGSRASTPYAWINGPVGRQLGIDCGQGMISEAKNKALARFINLALLNLVGLDIKSSNSPFGSIGPYVFAEDEESCLALGWNPYHVDLGKELNDNTLTISTATSWGNNLTPSSTNPTVITNVIADDITEKQDAALGGGASHCYRTIFIAEPVANDLKGTYPSKALFEDALISTAKRPFDLRAYAKYWADPEGSHSNINYDTYYSNLLSSEATITTEGPPPDWYTEIMKDPNTQTPTNIRTSAVMKKGETRILVLGDTSRNKVQTLTGGASVTIEIKLPNKWDALLEQVNQDPKTFQYLEPIRNFCLDKSKAPSYDTDTPLTAEDIRKFTDSTTFFAVMSPVGKNTIEQIKQAPRLDTLAGKTIALVGRSFSAPITQAVIKELIERDYPTATVLTVDDVGYGGSYSPLHPSEQNKAFQEKLKEYKVDAVISGNCGCGLCTVKECGSSICAEYIGIPTVTVGAPTFIGTIHSTGTNRGVTVLRAVEYPHAFTSDTTRELQDNARDILYPNIVKELTRQITQEEIDECLAESEIAYNEEIVSGSYEMIEEYSRMVGWSDGLPVGLATADKVEEYLQYTPYIGRTSLGTIPVAFREAKVYTVAVNAIMAGVPPQYLPLCIAFVQAMTGGEWRQTLTSTHGWSPYAWINGPVARQFGIASGKGMINNANNRKFARFIDFAMLNIGGYYIKENRVGTFGYLTPWAFSEDEQACLDVGWNPYHVDQGFSLNDNTVTAASSLFWGTDLTPQSSDPQQVKDIVAFDITEKQQNALGNTNPQVYRTMFLTKPVAQVLKNQYSSKSLFEDALITTARRPFWLRVYAHFWANTGADLSRSKTLAQHYDELYSDEAEGAATTDVPPWYQKMLTGTTQMVTGATVTKGNTPLLIAGDAAVNRVQILPGGGYSTVMIELAENWDELAEELGYQPLKTFCLEEEEPKIVGPVPVPAVLIDGTYRIAASEAQVNTAGTIFADQESGIVTYYTSESGEAKKVADQNLAFVISTLGRACSVQVSGGVITKYILRPAPGSDARIDHKDLTALDSNAFKDATVSIALTQASIPDTASIVLSSSVNRILFDLSEDIVILNGNTPGFLTKSSDKTNDGERYVLDATAKYDSVARLGFKTSDNTYTIFTITKGLRSFILAYYSAVETYSITYHANGGVGDDYVVSNLASGENVLATLEETRFAPQDKHTFAGWATTKTGKAIRETVISIEGNTDLYAVWTDESEPAPEPDDDDESDPSHTDNGDDSSSTTVIVIVVVLVVLLLAAVAVSVVFFIRRKKQKSEGYYKTAEKAEEM